MRPTRPLRQAHHRQRRRSQLQCRWARRRTLAPEAAQMARPQIVGPAHAPLPPRRSSRCLHLPMRRSQFLAPRTWRPRARLQAQRRLPTPPHPQEPAHGLQLRPGHLAIARAVAVPTNCFSTPSRRPPVPGLARKAEAAEPTARGRPRAFRAPASRTAQPRCPLCRRFGCALDPPQQTWPVPSRWPRRLSRRRQGSPF